MADMDDKLKEALKEAVVLYVEDEDEVRSLASRYLSRTIPNLLVAGSGEEALRLAEGKEIDILVTDISMDTMDGAELAVRIKSRNPFCYIIFSTAYCNTDRLMQAVEIKVDEYMVKPIDWKKLSDSIASYAMMVYMLKHSVGGEEQNNDTGSLDAYNVLNEALASLDEAIGLMSGENSADNAVKTMHNLKKTRECIEKVLEDYF